MSKKVAVAEEDVPNSETPKITAMIRIEDTVEDFIRQQLGQIPGTRFEAIPVYTIGGSTRYRVNYWRIIKDALVPSRKLVTHYFIRVERQGGQKVMIDMTLEPGR